MNKNESLFYTPKKIAEILDISVVTVYEMTRDGRMPSVSLKGPKGTRSFVRIPKRWIDARLEEGGCYASKGHGERESGD